MSHISLYPNGNGQLAVYPSSDESSGTLITVRSFPYTGEELVFIEFAENINGSWQVFVPMQSDYRSWQFRIEEYNVRVVATFTERHPTPPDPPDPPAPIYSNWFIAVLGAIKKKKRRI